MPDGLFLANDNNQLNDVMSMIEASESNFYMQLPDSVEIREDGLTSWAPFRTRKSSLSELVQVASLSVGAMVASGLYDNAAALNAVTDEVDKRSVVPDGLPLYILSVRTWLHELTKDVACGSKMYLWNTLFNIYATVSSAVVQYGECGNPR